MKVLFYSKKCKFSNQIINKINESKFSSEFKMINIDNSDQVPDQIKVVPTIIDPEFKDLLEGKKAFDYLNNKKYFDNSTNNFHLWKDKEIPIPKIDEDKFANQDEDILEIQNIKNINEIKENKVNNKKKIIIKNSSLLRMKK
jgi:hypothetical protein